MADRASEQQFAAFLQSQEQNLNGQQQRIQQIVNQHFQQCVESSRNDVSAFVDCQSKFQKRLVTQQRRFEIGLSFVADRAIECYNQAGSRQDQCNATAKDQIDRIFNTLVSKLQ